MNIQRNNGQLYISIDNQVCHNVPWEEQLERYGFRLSEEFTAKLTDTDSIRRGGSK